MSEAFSRLRAVLSVLEAMLSCYDPGKHVVCIFQGYVDVISLMNISINPAEL